MEDCITFNDKTRLRYEQSSNVNNGVMYYGVYSESLEYEEPDYF